MQWQDILITIGSWIFAIALVPSILNRTSKPALSSSLITASILTIYVVVYASLRFWGSAASTALVAAAWWILAYQKWRLNNKENSGRNTPAN